MDSISQTQDPLQELGYTHIRLQPDDCAQCFSSPLTSCTRVDCTGCMDGALEALLVENLVRQSVIVGATDAAVTPCASPLTLANLTECTVFVTASVTELKARNLKRCTVVCAPCSVGAALSQCSDSVVSIAAPGVVVLEELAGCHVFLASAVPVSVGAGCRDVRVGPYNVVGDGVLSGSGMRAWALDHAAPGGDALALCRLDAGAGAVRPIPPDDFFWRFLPVPQTLVERLPLPVAYATPDVPAPQRPTAERSPRVEALLQSKFVTWLLADSKANSLKHIYRQAER